MEDNIILSICIPTYNRAKFLEDTLNTIVRQKRFIETSDVEIVISDNCSTDNTEEVCLKFVAKYGNKVRYLRSPENIWMRNIQRVLSLAKGKYLKLNNDTLSHEENSLDLMVRAINENSVNHRMIYFSNGSLRNITKRQCPDLNVFVKTTSYFSTWIGSFGIWREDLDKISNFNSILEYNLINNVLYDLVIHKGTVIVDNTKIFNSVRPTFKGDYNIYEVFVTNYLAILGKYKATKQVSWLTFFIEKSKLLMNFVIPWTLMIWKNSSEFNFDKKGALNILFRHYRFHPVFYIGIVYFLMRAVWIMIKNPKIIYPGVARSI
jgi:abequosyltransferase